MFVQKCVIILSFLLLSVVAHTQVPDSSNSDQSLAVDTSLDYDDMLNEFVDFIDSILAPRSYFLVNVAGNHSYFYYKRTDGRIIVSKKKLVLTPTAGYYHKSGPGITVSGSLVRPDARGEKNFRFYQYAITPSYDLIQSRRWVAGISYSRFITKDSLQFYTTPLQNEVTAYYLFRKSWIQPGVTVNYGWGSRTDVEKRKAILDTLRLLDRLQNLINPGSGVVTTTTEENIIDFSITASIRHSFYWTSLSKHNDYIKLTPMLTFSAGTQKYGFNQTRAASVTVNNAGKTQYYTGKASLDNKLEFQPLSATLYIRPEYSIGKFFIQPQFILDYYFPAKRDNFSMLFTMNAGLMF